MFISGYYVSLSIGKIQDASETHTIHKTFAQKNAVVKTNYRPQAYKTLRAKQNFPQLTLTFSPVYTCLVSSVISEYAELDKHYIRISAKFTLH